MDLMLAVIAQQCVLMARMWVVVDVLYNLMGHILAIE
jgi:hypothetical protein